MKRILTAAILLLWAGCFFHCSAEQFGLVECNSPSCESCPCPEEDCGDCGDEGDHDKNEPCGLCDFIHHGGSPTVSPLVVDDFSPEESGVDLAWHDLSINIIDLMPPNAAARGSCRGAAPPRKLCELLARNSVPLRGPTA